MNNSRKLVKEICGYIADINPQEIASHIADGTLNNWLQVWRSSFKYCIHQCIEEYRKEDGWILVSEKTPKLKNPFCLLILIENSVMFMLRLVTNFLLVKRFMCTIRVMIIFR